MLKLVRGRSGLLCAAPSGNDTENFDPADTESLKARRRARRLWLLNTQANADSL